MAERGSRWRVGVDTGGTFTDVVALNEATGEIVVTKTPSTPHDPSIAVAADIRKIRGLTGAIGISTVCHGTTIATNAVLQGHFDDLGLLTTAGFRHILEIARQSVPRGYGNSYFWVKPERIVPLHRVGEVPERMTFDGRVARPFDEAAAVAQARWLRRQRIRAIGVCFIHAYANPEHERRMRAVLAREYPEAHVSISSDVLPEYREYERTVTTLVDAFVKSRVSDYVGAIRARLEAELGQGVPFYVMKSNGGIIVGHEVARQPITTILSGPAAGALGASFLARHAGFDRVLTADVGGTSTDVCLVEHDTPGLTTEGTIGQLPVKVPMIDIVTVGSGGGSVAWLAPDGTLKVGPQSAGADPGPLCYGRGGREVTVTDAHLLLGRIPAHLLGGEIPLDRDAAASGLAALGRPLGLDPQRCAEGVLELTAWNQANAIRQVSVKRGLDPRDYTLVAFGGAGPLLAGRLIDLLGLRAALIPLSPGNVSALGLLVVDLRNDYVQTCVRREDQLDFETMNGHLHRLQAQAQEALRRQGFGDADMRFVRSADMRYFGQAWEVQVELPPGPLDAAAARLAAERFHAVHHARYGYSYRTETDVAPANRPGGCDGVSPPNRPGCFDDVSPANHPGGLGGSRPPQHGQSRPPQQQMIEWVNLRVTGIGPIERPKLRELPPGDGQPERARRKARSVIFDGETYECPVYDRAALRPGDALAGLAVVEEYGATTVVFPNQGAEVDRFGNLILMPRPR
jgi:N-methylhydantoinase A